MVRVVLFSGALFVAAAAALAAGDDRVKIAVSPNFSFEPSYMRVRVHVEPNAENRTLVIIADSDGFYRRSDVQLDGDESPATIEIPFREVPGGEYEIRAVLIDNMGRECAVSRANATVISRTRETREP